MEPSELKFVNTLEEENSQLKKMDAYPSLENMAIRDLLGKLYGRACGDGRSVF